MKEIFTLEDWRIAGADIDELETAITKLSQYPVATQALLAALQERQNVREVALQKIINKERLTLRIASHEPTIAQLKKRAKNFGIAIRKYERGEDSYVLADMTTGVAVATYPMTKDQVVQWFDDLDNQQDTGA